ncbi:cell wall-active antibiotics response protein LiaF [Paenibacillus sp. sgz302251]|uniref:cell wall-active antibiotics response protein LiaF n=1 Tax=Paenibacillus sp. sgz302251 TaxID=3414493 RepID=UPI003C7C3211
MNGNFLNRLFTGLIIIAVGVVFLLRQMGHVTIDIGDIISTYWPVILIIVGIKGLLTGRSHGSGSGWWGAIVLLIGFVFLGRNLGWFAWSLGDIISYIWPVIIIIVGINLIWRPKSRRYQPPADDWKSYRPYQDNSDVPPAPPLHPDPTKSSPEKTGIDLGKSSQEAKQSYGSHAHSEETASYKKSHKHHKRNYKEHMEWWNHSDPNVQTRSGFIGDIHIGHDYWDLKPLNISHFIGDTVLDLTKAQIGLGETKICISSFIGDVKIYVPNDFEVGVQVVSSAFIGDVKVLERKEGGMFNNINIQSPFYTESDKKIKLIVSTFIGDVRVTKVG